MAYTITVASSEVGANLTDFPVAVDLSQMPASFWSSVDEDGDTIAVFNDASTRLPVDVVRLDHGDEAGWLVFLADSVSSSADTSFTLDFSGAGEAAYDTDDVWAGFVGVWLLGESPLDRSGNGHHLSNVGDPNLWELIESAPISNVHEGVTTDGTHYYGFDSAALRKFDSDWNSVTTNTSIGSGAGNPGFTDLGGGTHHDGKLYVAADASGTHYLSVWDASDLSFIEAFNIESFADSAADFTYNPADGLLYTVQFSGGGVSTFIKIDPSDGSDQGTLSLSLSLINANGLQLWRDAYWVAVASDEVARVELDGTVNFGGQFGPADNGIGTSIDGDSLWCVNNDTPHRFEPYDIDLGLGGGAEIDGAASNIRLYTELGSAHGTEFTLGATLTLGNTNSFNTIIVTASTLGSTANRAMISTTNGGVWQQFDAANGAMSGTSSVAVDTPYRSHVVWDDTASKTSYVNGVEDAQETGISAIGGSNDVVAIGDNNDDPVGGGGSHQGLAGFLYIRDEALSADWIATEYTMLNANATLITVAEAPSEVSLQPDGLSHAQSLDAATVEQVHALTPAGLSHGHTLEAATIVEDYLLTADSLAHAQTVEAASLAQTHVLTAADLLHGHALEAATLDQIHQLTAAGLSHPHTLAEAGLTQAHTLTPAGLSHAHALESAALDQAHALTPNGLSHAHALEQAALTQAHTLTPAGLAHAHTIEQASLDVADVVLTPNGLAHAQTVESAAISQVHQLQTDDLRHAQSVEPVTLRQDHTLTPDALAHSQALDPAALVVDYVLTPAGLSHAQTVEQATVEQVHVLAADDLSHGQTVEEAGMAQDHVLTADGLRHAQTLDQVVMPVFGVTIAPVYDVRARSGTANARARSGTYDADSRSDTYSVAERSGAADAKGRSSYDTEEGP